MAQKRRPMTTLTIGKVVGFNPFAAPAKSGGRAPQPTGSRRPAASAPFSKPSIGRSMAHDAAWRIAAWCVGLYAPENVRPSRREIAGKPVLSRAAYGSVQTASTLALALI